MAFSIYFERAKVLLNLVNPWQVSFSFWLMSIYVINVATKQAKLRCATVIPARPPQCYGGWTKAGIQEIRHVIDSGSPLRAACPGGTRGPE